MRGLFDGVGRKCVKIAGLVVHTAPAAELFRCLRIAGSTSIPRGFRFRHSQNLDHHGRARGGVSRRFSAVSARCRTHRFPARRRFPRARGWCNLIWRRSSGFAYLS